MKQCGLRWLWNQCVVGELQIGDPMVTLNSVKFKSTYDDKKSNIIRLPTKHGESTKLIVIECETTETFRKTDNVSPMSSPSMNKFATEDNNNNSTLSSSCSVDLNSFYHELNDKCVYQAYKKRKLSGSNAAFLIHHDDNANQNSNSNNKNINESYSDDEDDDMVSESVSQLNLNSNNNNNNNLVANDNDLEINSNENENLVLNDDNNLDTFKSYNSNVMIVNKYMVNGVPSTNYELVELGTYHIGKCAIRAAAQLNRKGVCIGTLILIKHCDIKTNELIISHSPVGYLSNYFNNPKKLAEDLSSAIAQAAGINASFTPTVVGKDSDLEKFAGISFLKRFIIPQSNRIKRVMECVDNLGRTVIDDQVFITLPGGTIIDVAKKKCVSALEANIYMDGWAEKIPPEEYKNYPRLIEGQVTEPLSAELSQSLVKLVANVENVENVVLFVIILAMQLIPLVGWKHLVKYGGGVMLLLVIYGLPKSTKSWLLRLAESLYGINHFTDDVAELGQSKNILEDWTTKGLQYRCKQLVGFARKCEDGDRPGNKENSGGPEAVIWSAAGFGDTVTKGGGDEAGNTSGIVMTVNSTPTFYEKSKNNKNKNQSNDKKDGSSSRGLFWHHQAGHDIATRTQQQAQQANILVQPLVKALQKRTGIYLTNCIPSDRKISKAGEWIDRMNNDLVKQYPYLMTYLFDSRQQSQAKLMLAYGNLISKNVINFDRAKLTAGIFNWNFKTAQFWYKLNGNPMFLIEDKCKSSTEIIKYFIECFRIAHIDLQIELQSTNTEIEMNDNEDENKQTELNNLEANKNVDVDVLLKELQDLQRHIKGLHLVELFIRQSTALIGFNISQKIEYGELLKIFELFDQLLIKSENYKFCDIDTKPFIKWKYMIVKIAELNNIFAYLDQKGLIFSNQARYKGVRIGFSDCVPKLEYRYKSVIVPLELKSQWQELYNVFGKNGKRIGVVSKKKKKIKLKTENNNNKISSDEKKDNQNNNIASNSPNIISEPAKEIMYCMDEQCMLNLLCILIKNEKCGDLFVEPVDLNVYPSYKQEINDIICLKDIKLKIQNNQYNKNACLFAHDIRLVFNNAKEFNASDSEVYQRACHLSIEFEKLFMHSLMQNIQQTAKQKINYNTNMNAQNIGLR